MAGARNARLYFEDDHKSKRIGAWCANKRKNQWLKIDLGRKRKLTGIATQGLLISHKGFYFIEYTALQTCCSMQGGYS